MLENKYELLNRVCFLLAVLLIAGNLAVFSYRVSANSTPDIKLSSILLSTHRVTSRVGTAANKTVGFLQITGNVITRGTHLVGNVASQSASFAALMAYRSVGAVVHVSSGAVNLVSSASSVNSFIKPAQNARLPVITPIKLASSVTPAAPVSPTVASPPVPAPAATTVKPQNTAPLVNIKQADLYAWGNCTWWVFIRRSQINDPIPNTWGNATTWAERAAKDGYLVNHSPSLGAIMQIPYVDYGLGHVAFVESVDPDGTWHISEMNVIGLDHVDYKAEPAAAAAKYFFIHDKVS